MQSRAGATGSGCRGLELLELLQLALPRVPGEAVPEVEREAGEDRPLGRVEDVQPVDGGCLGRSRRRDVARARPAATSEVTYGRYTSRPSMSCQRESSAAGDIRVSSCGSAAAGRQDRSLVRDQASGDRRAGCRLRRGCRRRSARARIAAASASSRVAAQPTATASDDGLVARPVDSSDTRSWPVTQ